MAEHPSAAPPCRPPVFILTTSRSGSTLLRFLLDTHPEFACPPESRIATACAHLLYSLDVLENAGADRARPEQASAVPSDEALSAVREVVDRAYARYLRRRGKPRWCDKSLDTFMAAPILLRLYPEALFICLYRHCMDVVSSGIEASPWGLSRFGFEAYAARYPGNSVAAIGAYWLDCVEAILAFESAHPGRCHRIRYEDLVSAPEQVSAGLFAFLGARQAPGITRDCFSAPHDANGPADEKIWFTNGVTADSVGRGCAVPAGALPPPLRGRINQALARLEYRIVDSGWDGGRNPADPRADGSAGPEAGPQPGKGSAADADPGTAIAALRGRIGSLPDGERLRLSELWPAVAGETVVLAVTGPGGARAELSWTVPGPGCGSFSPRTHPEARAAAAAGGESALTLVGDSATWRRLLDGDANLIAEISAGRLRCVTRSYSPRARSDELHAIGWLLGLARVPVTRVPAVTPGSAAVPDPA